MNKEKILENVGEIDPRFIREAAPSPRRRMLRIAAAAAAVVLLAVGLALVLPKLVKPEKELSSAVPSGADLPASAPDPIVPGMKAQMPWMIPQEWYRERGELGFRLFDESSLRFSGEVGSEQELFSVVDALSSNWSINVDGSLAGVSENAPRIVLFSGDDELVIWQGSNFVKYSGSGAIRWFRADDYVGSKFGTGYIFDELMNGPLLREYAAGAETSF
ncbi:MAG: hypothetical protein J6P98_04120 [Clostridia bacterium]|nr:hypothetical protein [Clostridia bacterium]